MGTVSRKHHQQECQEGTRLVPTQALTAKATTTVPTATGATPTPTKVVLEQLQVITMTLEKDIHSTSPKLEAIVSTPTRTLYNQPTSQTSENFKATNPNLIKRKAKFNEI